MPIGRTVRHFGRYREVVNALARHGFGLVLGELGLDNLLDRRHRRVQAGGEATPSAMGRRLRLLLEELGPTYVKLGQFLSTRPDLLPEEVVAELEGLQDNVAPLSFTVVRQVVEEEFGRPLSELYATFEEAPIAAASIGQVHGATLADGRHVVVKVQRPNVARRTEVDLEILADIAHLAEQRSRIGRVYRVGRLAEEFAHLMRSELDYRIEGGNADQIRARLPLEGPVVVPPVVWERSTRRVLTLGRLEGVKLQQLIGDPDALPRRREVARILARTVLEQILVHGLFHADPHPGNVLLLPDGRIGLLDFGLVGRLDAETVDGLAELFLALVLHDGPAVAAAIDRLREFPMAADLDPFRREVERLYAKYSERPLEQIRLADLIAEGFRLAYRHQIRFPIDLALVGKALITLEGVVVRLDPGLRIGEIAEPFARSVLRERLLKRYLGRDGIARLLEWGRDVAAIPRHLRRLLRRLEQGPQRLHVELDEIERLLVRLDQVGNRLSLGLLLLAASILMAGVLVAAALEGQGSLLWNLPLIEFGFLGGAFLFLWLHLGDLPIGAPVTAIGLERAAPNA